MKLIKVQIMGENSANWKYTIKERIEYINKEIIKRIVPCSDIYKVYIASGEKDIMLAIDKESFDLVLENN